MGEVTVRQAGRPLARMVERLANRSSAFRRMVCLPLAQFYHYYEVKMRLAALNLGVGKVTKVTKLSEENAVKQASEIISEASILGVVAVILVHEYRKSKAESEQVEAESRMARERIFELETQLEGNAEQIRNLVRSIVRNSDKERRLPKELRDSLAEKPIEVKRIVMLEDDLERDAVTLNSSTKSRTTKTEKKTMSEELEELWEEVVEEILDTVNPEEDD